MTTGTIVLNLVLSVATTAVVGGTAFLVPFKLDRGRAVRTVRTAAPTAVVTAGYEQRLAA